MTFAKTFLPAVGLALALLLFAGCEVLGIGNNDVAIEITVLDESTDAPLADIASTIYGCRMCSDPRSRVPLVTGHTNASGKLKLKHSPDGEYPFFYLIVNSNVQRNPNYVQPFPEILDEGDTFKRTYRLIQIDDAGEVGDPE